MNLVDDTATFHDSLGTNDAKVHFFHDNAHGAISNELRWDTSIDENLRLLNAKRQDVD